ncbi:hypothetical protein C8J57DRAFT_1282043 [Mycena rebaudengoi]|nr:hypothetical protein C8J57DRAFT_1282043 [Mycena rebaudengoi]
MSSQVSTNISEPLALAKKLLADLPILANNPNFTLLIQSLEKQEPVTKPIPTQLELDLFDGDLTPPPSPALSTSSTLFSASPSLGKRKRAQLDADWDNDHEDDDDDEYDEEDGASARRLRGGATTRSQSQRGQAPSIGTGSRCKERRNAAGTSQLRTADRAARLRGGQGTPPTEQSKTPPSKKARHNAEGKPPKVLSQGGQLLCLLSKITTTAGQDNLRDLKRYLTQDLSASFDSTSPISLVQLATYCNHLIDKQKAWDFRIMMGLIRFRLALHNTTKGMQDLADESDVSLSKLKTMKALGTRFLYLAGGGTFYLLLIIASLGYKDKFGDQAVLSLDIENVANALADPQPNDSWASIVTYRIIPQIQRMYHDPEWPPLVVSGCENMTLHDVKKNSASFVNVKIAFDNIEVNDAICRKIKTSSIVLRDRSSLWAKLQEIPGPNIPPIPKSSRTHIISTPIRVPSGTTCPVPADREGCAEWTNQRRLLAEQGLQAMSISDLGTQLNRLHESEDPTSYIRFDTKRCEGDTIDIRGKDNEDVAIIITDLSSVPGVDVDRITDLLQAALGDGLFDADSSFEHFTTEAIHLEPAYNRYSEMGTGAPTDEHHAHFIQREDVTRVNHGQRIPRPNQEIVKDPLAYEALVQCMIPVCEHVASKLFELRPDFADELVAYISILPRNELCPFAPFGGIVVNFNACSDGHLDSLDLDKKCVVIPFMKDCRGGGLVLHEARLVLDLHSGDIVLFSSGRFVHFNLHYQGVRASVVLHTDSHSRLWTGRPGKGGKKKAVRANGWEGVKGVQLEI